MTGDPAAEPEVECTVIELGDGSRVRFRYPAGSPPTAATVQALMKLKSYLEAHPNGPVKGEDLEVDAPEIDDAHRPGPG